MKLAHCKPTSPTKPVGSTAAAKIAPAVGNQPDNKAGQALLRLVDPSELASSTHGESVPARILLEELDRKRCTL